MRFCQQLSADLRGRRRAADRSEEESPLPLYELLYELIVGVTGSMDCFCVEQEQDAVRRPTNDICRQSARLMVKQLHEHAMLSRRDTQAWPHET